MSESRQRIWAPLLILVALVILWETLVTAFNIQQFLLPKPSAILGNLAQVVVTGGTASADESGAERSLNNRFFVVLPGRLTPEVEEHLQSARWLEFPIGGRSVHVVRGSNLTPILAASWFTLKEALGGMAMGTLAGVAVALATTRWTASREALLPFAIAANSMPIIAFAPIMNNWFGIDNPFSKMAIVTVMIFFPIMINTLRGLISVDSRSLELMHSYAAGDSEILFKLRIPNALPSLFSGLKVAGALAMIGAIVGEYFGGPRIALGVFITQEAALFRFASAWAAIIVACLIGITIYLVILLAERLALPWHPTFRK
ncbi:MAG: ABC transporter permease [Caldilineaceae bacterium SB0664_bin_27]|uniref:ABC transporter permease n=1 Tax=Caldilineaceae bacterium SB0664_bin_27 TaxID=2605260 RepID=A0A6B0YNP3_9CHLR|nr:ABC transporter permease [Caldilineaceae bacterium SB0664_bin_27]